MIAKGREVLAGTKAHGWLAVGFVGASAYHDRTYLARGAC